MLNKIRHFYFNKYLVSPFCRKKYYLSYSFRFKALWFRVPKVGSRTIHQHFLDHSLPQEYIYSSRVGYLREMYRSYFKFAFVRHPVDRLMSTWRNKVLEANYFQFDPDEYLNMQSIEEFISWLAAKNIHEVDEHLLPQTDLIDLSNLDFMGRFENFDNDLIHVAGAIGLPLEHVYHKNPSTRTKIKVTRDLQVKIQEIYRQDFNDLNYRID